MKRIPETIRPCPRCGGWPATIYEPKVYQVKGKDVLVRQSYCSTCQKTYGQTARRVAQPVQLELPLPKPRRKQAPRKNRMIDATLADVLANPEPWASVKTGTRRWAHLRLLILERDDYSCKILGPTCLGTATQVDHIVPTPEGDSHPDNLRAACGPCNGSRFQRATFVCHDCGSTNVQREHR